MSLRTSLRQFGTSARSHLPATAEQKTTPTGFQAIRDLLSSSPSPSQAPTSAAPALTPTQDASAPRGYSPHAVPPTADPTIDLLTNCLMKDGKKSEAQKMVASVLGLLHTSTNLPPQPLVRQAVLLSSPAIKMLSMRKSAKTVLSPRALTERQRTRQGVAWILKAAEKGRKGGVSRDQRIAREILGVLEGQSDVFKWLEERHKVAYLNRSNMTAR